MLFCNSGCIHSTIMWGIWYINEGFLIWIIPSTYLSHEAVIWVVLLVLPYLLSSGFNSNFWLYYNYCYFMYFWFYHLRTTPLISCYYHIVHILSLTWYYTCITVPSLLTYLSLVLYRLFGYHIIKASWHFILFSLVVIMDSSGCAYSIDGDMKYIVYRWELSYLDYPLEISILWIYLLSLYN